MGPHVVKNTCYGIDNAFHRHEHACRCVAATRRKKGPYQNNSSRSSGPAVKSGILPRYTKRNTPRQRIDDIKLESRYIRVTLNDKITSGGQVSALGGAASLTSGVEQTS